MSISKRIKSFSRLGLFLNQFKEEGTISVDLKENDSFLKPFEMLLNRASETNPWFTRSEIIFSLESWAKALTEENLENWISKYDLKEPETPKRIAVIMAGNIPLVGFHDFLSVLLTGNYIQAKLSSNDPHFMEMIAHFLKDQDDFFKDAIEITKEELSDFDAVIATGSDNTARYFEYYFGKHPNIIRHNRNSVAILTGNETQEELRALGEDIFRYFGLGCRNVSKLYVPENYNFDPFFQAMYHFKDLTKNQRYMNNFDYNKAVFLMSESENMLENGFMLLKEDTNFSSPIACLFFEHYKDEESLKKELLEQNDRIQCKVGTSGGDFIPFGKAQQPDLKDYADGVDTIEFLKNLG
ncbi:MAG: acyl-CoA reductase [Flavobacteriaceae bacterium]